MGRFYVTLDEARKIACAKLKENPQYNVVIAKYTDSDNTATIYVTYSDVDGFRSNGNKINPKTGKLVKSKAKANSKSNIPKYFAYSDVDDEVTFRDNDLNKLRKAILNSPRYTFMYVIDARARKEVGKVEKLYRAWVTPMGNWYEIKSNGSLGSKTQREY